ncbi:dTMP kinase [Sphingomonas gellani]|uniref:Thymidylate kinase n=1 Tax=Sphingomonas gellani TaxID=1166340 RepID=A0A1H8DN76_9SPHN|nr:thymidylate kinase [Sphingomonas gellani]SEN08663.1 dTMP kinase [Sphingomonas gellani]
MAYHLAIEGADGAGKGTVSAALVEALRAQGRRAALVSFPRYAETVGGYAIGEVLAGRMPRTTSPEAAAVLYALDRLESRDHVRALADDHDVLVFDRHVASNMAYQAARTSSIEEAGRLMRWIWQLETEQFGLIPPDRAIYLDTPAEVARGFIRLKQQRSYTARTFDEYEADDALQNRVRDNYRGLAAADPERWRIVATVAGEGPRAPAEIAQEIVAGLPLT